MINCYSKPVLLSVFILFGFQSFAQVTRIDTVKPIKLTYKPSEYESQKQYHYSIGVKAFSIEEFPKILNQVNSTNYINTAMNGVFLKLNDNQISYRLSGNYLEKNITFRNKCEDCEKAYGKLKDFSAKIGFEKNFNYAVLQPYFAFDFGYRRNSFDGDVENATALNFTTPYEVKTLKNGFLMSPNLGVKINLLSRVTLVAETGMGLLYSYEKQEKIFKDVNRTRSVNTYNKWEFLLTPVSMLGIQVNLSLAD